jgi:hypothetical protein
MGVLSMQTLCHNLAKKKVPTHMRVVEDIQFRPIGTTGQACVQTKSVVHFVEMHSGSPKRLMQAKRGPNHLQVYLAENLDQVSFVCCSFIRFCFSILWFGSIVLGLEKPLSLYGGH